MLAWLIVKTDHTKCWDRSAITGTGTLIPEYQESKTLLPPWKSVWPFPLKANIHLPYHPTIPLVCIYPREMKTCAQ